MIPSLRAFPAPEQIESRAETVVEARTPVEESVAQIWAELLSLRRVSIHDHFFDLGSHSLLAMQLLLRVHDRLQVEVPLRAFFAAPTVAAMAEIIVQLQLQHLTPEALEQMLADTETPPSSS